MKRGDVVIADFPFFDQPGSKRRPALVVQADVYNAKMVTTVLAMISGNIKHASDPAQCLVDPGTSDSASSGLRGPSVVKCTNLVTVYQANVIYTIGQLSPRLMQRVDACLKQALGIP